MWEVFFQNRGDCGWVNSAGSHFTYLQALIHAYWLFAFAGKPYTKVSSPEQARFATGGIASAEFGRECVP